MYLGNFTHRRARRNRQSGYILLVLMLFATLLVMATLATAPDLGQQIRRDREEEMIHRGAQYSRAIKRYFKKFGSYPSSLEALENTNNTRFLRKQYKDPMSKDGKWKSLHFGDVQIAGASNIGVPVSQLNSQPGAQSQPNRPGGLSGGPIFTPMSTPGATGQTGAQPGGLSGPTTPGIGGSSLGQREPRPPRSGTGSTASPQPTGPQFGGGAVIGVASTSTQEGLKAFNQKNHYNEWYFVYDPTQDRGALINGPYDAKQFANAGAIPGANPIGQQPGAFGQQPGAFGQQPGAFGQQPFGQPATPQQPRRP